MNPEQHETYCVAMPEPESTRQPGETPIVFLLPVYNDWESAHLLLNRLNETARGMLNASVLLVDDGSTSPLPVGWRPQCDAFESVDVLSLRRNLGHQRAIAIGLTYLHQLHEHQAVVVMDADGEDRPEDVHTLLEEFHRHDGQRIVFAARARRTESVTFRVFYILYKFLHLLLTGRRVEVGNFSVVPHALLDRLVVSHELWNHYAASVHALRISRAQVPIGRGHRLCGQSRMNFLSLVLHGLSAISVFGTEVIVRILVVACLLLVTSGIAAATLLLTSLFGMGGLSPTGWIILSVLAGAQLNALLVLGTCQLMVLYARNQVGFIPLVHYRHFIRDSRNLWSSSASLHSELARAA